MKKASGYLPLWEILVVIVIAAIIVNIADQIYSGEQHPEAKETPALIEDSTAYIRRKAECRNLLIDSTYMAYNRGANTIASKQNDCIEASRQANN